MEYKSIAVHLDNGKHCLGRARVAAALARSFDAHLVGLYAVDPVELYSLRDSAMAEAIVRQTRAKEEQALRAQSLFTQAVKAADLGRSEFRQSDILATEAIKVHARYADLLVIGQTDPDDRITGVGPTFPELVVLSTGRPTLVVPYYSEDYPRLGNNVLLAWSATREATRAMTDALPLLKQAKRVIVMSVNPVVSRDKHGEMPGADAALYLARHGVKAEAMQSYADEIGVGDELLARASDLEIDLIVMGAYGHSRLREVVLGGVTQTLLQHMTVPVLMSH
jgi:nucleotide-binding universal stress UspA family protein